jgi:hypothetical protein
MEGKQMISKLRKRLSRMTMKEIYILAAVLSAVLGAAIAAGGTIIAAIITALA